MQAPGASSGSAQSKHTPIVWNGGSKGGPDARKSPRQIAGTAAELAALELEEFKRSQHTAGIDPDAPAAMKASPSVTGSADGGEPAITVRYHCWGSILYCHGRFIS